MLALTILSRINLVEVFSSTHGILVIIQLTGILLGIISATIAAVLNLKFLKDFRIDIRENKKLNLINTVTWIGVVVLVLTNAGLYFSNPELYLNSSNLVVQFVVLIVTVVNNAILNLYINPRLVDTRIDLHSINVIKTFWLRQYSFALGAISLISWYTILIFTFFDTPVTGDVAMMISYYIAIAITGILISQATVFLIDKAKRN